MPIQPGEFWVADIPFTGGSGSKKRPGPPVEAEYASAFDDGAILSYACGGQSLGCFPSFSESRMLASTTVTFWRWLTGQPVSLPQTRLGENAIEEKRVWLRYAASLNVRCGEASGEGDSGVFAVICDISRGGIQLIAPRRFEPGMLISVELPTGRGEQGLAVLACVIRAHPHGDSDWTMGCRFSSELNEPQLAAFGAARMRPAAPDPRGWFRFPCDAQAFYQRVNGPAEPHRPARILNIAVGGMALLVDEPISVGELLSAELHDAKGQPVLTILACVVHAQTVPEGQLLGCNFIRELNDLDVQALL